jgi:ATP-dependent DNA helicase Q4
MDGYDNLIIKKLIIKIFDVCTSDCCNHIRNNSNTADRIEYTHHVALPVQELVESLDIKEETILTLLCYLQAANYIRLYSNCSKTCTIKSYKGSSFLNEMAKNDQFLANILQNKTIDTNDYSECTELNVDVIDLCNQLDGDYECIRNQIKKLEWNMDWNTGKYKSKTGISTQFTNISFYLKRKCIRSDSEMDEIYEHLWQRVCMQTNFCHKNFNALYKILNENSYKNISDYIDSFDEKEDDNKNESDNPEKGKRNFEIYI